MRVYGLAGAVALCVLSVLSVLEASPTRIDVTARPEGAKVVLDGESKGVVPVSVFNVTAGKHLLRVEAPGRRPVEEIIAVSDGDFITKDYDLDQEKGLLLVKTNPEGANVKFGGTSLGVTPLLVTDLDTDRMYPLSLESIGYQPKRVNVTLAGRTPVVVSEDLALDSGVVECTSEPAGATVQVNGIVRGTTPCRIDRIPKGFATFVFKLKGYEDEKRELRIVPGDSQSLSLSMRGRPAKLSVISYPEEARVTMDDNYVGKTPLTIAPVKSGVHTIRAELPGYAPVFKTVMMENGGELTEEIKFESILGWIEITTTPPGARIMIDGKAAGTTSAHRGKKADLSGVKSDVLFIRDVSAGEYQLLARLSGYAEAKGVIEVEANKATKLNLRLKRIFIPDTEIETVSGTYRGVLMDSRNPDTYRLEVKEGNMQDFRKVEVRAIRTIE